MVSFTACTGPQPEATVESFVTAAQEGDLETAATYVADGEDEFNFESEDYTEEQMSSLIKAFFGDSEFTYESETDGDTATVTATGEMPSFEKISAAITNDTEFLWTIAFMEEDEQFDAFYDKLISMVESGEYNEETTLTFTLEMTDGEWLITSLDGFMDDTE
jgi:hypothetical protein